MRKFNLLFLLGVLLWVEWAGAVFPVSFDKPGFSMSFETDSDSCRPLINSASAVVSELEAKKGDVDVSLKKIKSVELSECFDVQGGGPRVILTLHRKKKRVDIAFFASTSFLKFHLGEKSYIAADGVSVCMNCHKKSHEKGFGLMGPLSSDNFRLYVNNDSLLQFINARLNKMAFSAREVMLKVGYTIVDLCEAKTRDRGSDPDVPATTSACNGIVRIPHNAKLAPAVNEAISGYVMALVAHTHKADMDYSTIEQMKDEYMLSYAWKMLLSWCRLTIDWQETLGTQTGQFSTQELKLFAKENAEFFNRLYPLIDKLLDHFNHSETPEERLSVFENFVKSGLSAYLPKAYAMMPPVASFTFIEWLSKNLPTAIMSAVEIPLDRDFLGDDDVPPPGDDDVLSVNDVDIDVDDPTGDGEEDRKLEVRRKLGNRRRRANAMYGDQMFAFGDHVYGEEPLSVSDVPPQPKRTAEEPTYVNTDKKEPTYYNIHEDPIIRKRNGGRRKPLPLEKMQPMPANPLAGDALANGGEDSGDSFDESGSWV